MSLTDQGIRNAKQLPERRKAGIAAAEKLGIKVKETYMTARAYDVVIIADAPNDEAMTTWALGIGSQGNMGTQMIRAFSSDETDKMLAKLP
jgi:uncharacterized protein with GYD domain